MKIWFDILNTPQVHFLLSIKTILEEDNDFVFTARDFSETIKLLGNKLDQPFDIIGRHYGKNYFLKSVGLFLRFYKLYYKEFDYDISISNGSEAAVWSSFLKNKKSIVFGDNDTARQWTYARFCDFAFFPDAIPSNILNKQGLTNEKLYRYAGFKEDLYISQFIPDPCFNLQLPFKNYVLVRPENIMANYIRNGSVKSIVPALLVELNRRGYNVLYLPRYSFDREYVVGLKNVFIPNVTINGLDACYNADAVLTGAGTFAREAACLGIPAISFYAGSKLLAVDKKMINDNAMFYSRNIFDIMNYLKNSKKNEPNRIRSIAVYDEVKHKLIEVLNRFDLSSSSFDNGIQ